MRADVFCLGGSTLFKLADKVNHSAYDKTGCLMFVMPPYHLETLLK